jgi:hypothetical protein
MNHEIFPNEREISVSLALEFVFILPSLPLPDDFRLCIGTAGSGRRAVGTAKV